MRLPLRFGRYIDVAGTLERAGRIAVEQLHADRAMPIRKDRPGAKSM